MGDMNQIGNQDNWMDLYVPTNLSWDSGAGTFNDQYAEQMQPVYSSQSAEAAPFDPQRRNSMFYPNVSPTLGKLTK